MRQQGSFRIFLPGVVHGRQVEPLVEGGEPDPDHAPPALPLPQHRQRLQAVDVPHPDVGGVVGVTRTACLLTRPDDVAVGVQRHALDVLGAGNSSIIRVSN